MAERTAYDRPPTEAGRPVSVATTALVTDRPWGRLWGPIVYGAFVGFAVTLLTGAFALAAGLTATSVAAEEVEKAETGYVPGPTETHTIGQQQPQEDRGLDPQAKEEAAASAKTIGIGAGLWWIISSVLVGLAGGFAAGRMAEFIPRIMSFSVVVWTTGWLILLALSAFGAGSASGLTMGLGQVLGSTGASADPNAARMTGEALGFTSAGAWLLFLNMLISLGATMLGVRMGRKNRWKAWESETVQPSPAH